MGQRFLIDTNAAIELLMSRLPKNAEQFLHQKMHEGRCVCSVINRIELLSNPKSNEEQQKLLAFLGTIQIIPLNERIVLETIGIRQKFGLKLPDAVIAATSILQDAELITSDARRFHQISELKILNPHDL